MDRADRQWRQFPWFGQPRLEMIRDHHPVERLCGMRGPPADYDAAVAGLIEDVPDRFGLAREQGDRTHTRTVGQRLGEAVNAVFVGTFTGGNGGPKHRAEDRVKSGDIAVDTPRHEPGQMGHLASLQQRLNYLPVSRVPANEQNARLGQWESNAIRTGWQRPGSGATSELPAPRASTPQAPAIPSRSAPAPARSHPWDLGPGVVVRPAGNGQPRIIASTDQVAVNHAEPYPAIAHRGASLRAVFEFKGHIRRAETASIRKRARAAERGEIGNVSRDLGPKQWLVNQGELKPQIAATARAPCDEPSRTDIGDPYPKRIKAQLNIARQRTGSCYSRC